MKPRLTAAEMLILIFALLPAGRLAAQNATFDKIAPESLPAAPVETTVTPAAAKPERVFDKKFFVVMGALCGAESFRFTSRQLVLDHEYRRSLGHQLARKPTRHGQGFGAVWSRIPADLRTQEVALPTAGRPRHPQTLVGLSRRDDCNPHQERCRQCSHPGAWRLHLGGMRRANAVSRHSPAPQGYNLASRIQTKAGSEHDPHERQFRQW